ncbi:MAG: xylose isomerase [Actinoallomurus sp.]|nr:xylose isomerase [Actinoallomurus sp.]
MELLWAKTDPNNPKTLNAPPYDQVSSFLAEVKAGLAATKANPFDQIRTSIARFAASRDVKAPTAQLYATVSEADYLFRAGQAGQSTKRMNDFLSRTATGAARGDISPAAQQVLRQQMTALLQSFTDVFS